MNNQLLSYDPDTNNWVNPQCFGSVPAPRWAHASAIIRGKVFLFGGFIQNRVYTDHFRQLDMNSLTWTQLRIFHPKPMARGFCSLTATSNNQLVLHGGQSTQEEVLQVSDTWIMDLTSYTWRLHRPKRCYRMNHTATLGVNSNVIIIGGCKDVHNRLNVSLVTLEPKSLKEIASCSISKHQVELKLVTLNLCLPTGRLQGQAAYTIYKHVLPWKHLPKKLFHKSGYCLCHILDLS